MTPPAWIALGLGLPNLVLAIVAWIRAGRATTLAERSERRATAAEDRAESAEQRATEAHELMRQRFAWDSEDRAAEPEAAKLRDQLLANITAAHRNRVGGTHDVVVFRIESRAHQLALIAVRDRQQAYPIAEFHERDGVARITVWARDEYRRRFGKGWDPPSG